MKSMTQKTCARCGRELIVLAYNNRRTGQKERIVCDAQPIWLLPDDDGTHTALTLYGRIVRGVKPPYYPYPGAMPTYMPHRITCKGRKQG